MIYVDSDMSKSTNMVVNFEWKTVIYIYVCGKFRTQFMLPMEKFSHIHRRMCEWDYTIDKSLVCLQSERRTPGFSIVNRVVVFPIIIDK
jgi:hypothetical protein